jgi:hypothetical protein
MLLPSFSLFKMKKRGVDHLVILSDSFMDNKSVNYVVQQDDRERKKDICIFFSWPMSFPLYRCDI